MSRLATILALCVSVGVVLGGPAQAIAAAPNAAPPARHVKLVFIHHSTGQAWLDDAHGGLGKALRDNGYFVSDTNYGWGPDSIGSRTDIGNWWTWFAGPSSATYLAALYGENAQNCSYSRLTTEPAGPNEIVMFKSCFPNSALLGAPADPVPSIAANPLKDQSAGSEYHTVANAKGIYNSLLPYFALHQEKLFVVVCAPPLQDPSHAANARAFNDWLVSGWLSGYPHKNVFVFDYYNVLTTNGGSTATNDLGMAGGNHHRLWNGAIQHKTDGDDDGQPNVLEYPSGDDHPNAAGDRKATEEFLPLLNCAYNAWTGNETAAPAHPPLTYAPSVARVRRGGVATLYYRLVDNGSRSAVVTIVVKSLGGRGLKWLKLGLQPTGRLRHTHLRVRLGRGTYRFWVYAVDTAGYRQARLGNNRLVVR
jgi:hypothetical protein